MRTDTVYTMTNHTTPALRNLQGMEGGEGRREGSERQQTSKQR